MTTVACNTILAPPSIKHVQGCLTPSGIVPAASNMTFSMCFDQKVTQLAIELLRQFTRIKSAEYTV